MAETIASEATNLFFPMVLLLPIIFLILKHFKSYFLSKTTLPLPPGPSPWPILGNVLELGKKPHISLANLAQSYGPIMSLRLGTGTMIIGSSRTVAEEILKTHDRMLSARHVPHSVPPKCSKFNDASVGWAVECNDRWKNLRTICRTELFSAKAMESQACSREKKVLDMVQFLIAKEGNEVKVGEVAFATVYNILSNLLLSSDFMSFEKEIVDGGMKALLAKYIEVIGALNVSDLYPILGALDLQGINKKTMEVFMRICAMWEPIIKDRRQGSRGNASSQTDFLDALIDISCTDEQINYLLLELISAGTDSSTNAIEWAMAELIKSPESMKKVREEMTREIKQDVLKESHLPQLHYLQAVFKETLRLHPPAPLLIPRRAPDSCKVMNYSIPKNSQVAVNVWAIGRDPMNWEDPLKFKPQRFLNSTLDFKGNDFEFLPIGAGRIICPSQPSTTSITATKKIKVKPLYYGHEDILVLSDHSSSSSYNKEEFHHIVDFLDCLRQTYINPQLSYDKSNHIINQIRETSLQHEDLLTHFGYQFTLDSDTESEEHINVLTDESDDEEEDFNESHESSDDFETMDEEIEAEPKPQPETSTSRSKKRRPDTILDETFYGSYPPEFGDYQPDQMFPPEHMFPAEETSSGIPASIPAEDTTSKAAEK